MKYRKVKFERSSSFTALSCIVFIQAYCIFFITSPAAGMFANTAICGFSTKYNLIDSTAKTYLALGDSYTIGQSVDSAERFPAQTAALLRHRGITISTINYIATTGWKTVNLQWAIEAQKTRRTYDIVTLLIGVNDLYQNHDTAGYREHFINLVEKAIAFAGNRRDHVFILSIPDYSVTPFGRERKASAAQLDEFNAINKNVALNYQVSYTDVTGISRSDAIDPEMLAFDDMHPSGKQYEQWAWALEEKILPVLK